MPIIIAALVYGVLAALVFTLVAVIGLARGRQPGRAVLTGAGGNGQRRWWTEKGDIKWIDDKEHLENAIRDVNELQ